MTWRNFDKDVETAYNSPWLTNFSNIQVANYYATCNEVAEILHTVEKAMESSCRYDCSLKHEITKKHFIQSIMEIPEDKRYGVACNYKELAKCGPAQIAAIVYNGSEVCSPHDNGNECNKGFSRNLRGQGLDDLVKITNLKTEVYKFFHGQSEVPRHVM